MPPAPRAEAIRADDRSAGRPNAGPLTPAPLFPWPLILGAAIICLALALRLYHAEAQSLWYDEGTSVALSGRPLLDIVRAAAGDIHPPLYYLLLALWVRLVGDGVLVLRAFSALAGTALVAGVLGLGRRLWGWPVGLAAGLMAAVSPYLIWYSQEVRMYSLAAAWGVGLVWLTLDRVRGVGSGGVGSGEAAALAGGARSESLKTRLAPGPKAGAGLLGASLRGSRSGRPQPGLQEQVGPRTKRGWLGWLAWVGVATAALYTQYFVGGSVVAIANAIALLAALRAWWAERRFPAGFAARWIGAQIVVLLLFAPWLALAWPAIRDWPALGPAVGAGFIAREGLSTFSLGTRPLPEAMPWLPALLLLAAAGLLVRGRDGSRWAAAVALTYAVVPLALMGVMSLTRPAWNPKFLIAGAPGFELLAGAGVVGIAAGAAALVRAIPGSAGVPPTRPRDRVARVAGIAVACTLLLLILRPRAQMLAAMYFDPAYQRDDYRGIAAQIAAEAGAEDAVILNAPTQVEVFDYYNRGRLPTYPLPLERPADRAATLARLEEIGRTHRDLYAVLWATDESDPEGIVEGWLNANRYKVFDEWHGNVRLALWAAERGPMTPRWDLDAIDSGFGEPLDGYQDWSWPLRLGDIATGPTSVRPGKVLIADVRWGVMSPLDTDYEVFMHLLDGAGNLVAQRDMAPAGGSARTSALTPGQYIHDRIGFQIPASLAPGEYEWIIGLYDPKTSERLPVWLPNDMTGDSVSLGKVKVTVP